MLKKSGRVRSAGDAGGSSSRRRGGNGNDDEEEDFEALLGPHVLRRPAEPSSHSSSVAANPTANYSQHDYSRDYRNGWRVVRPSAGATAGGAGTRTASQGNTNANANGPARKMSMPAAVSATPQTSSFATRGVASHSAIHAAVMPPPPSARVQTSCLA